MNPEYFGGYARAILRKIIEQCLDMSVEACRMRLHSHERDSGCYLSREQIEKDRTVIRAARDSTEGT